MLIIASYTANLAAFLTVETLERPIKTAEDLAHQTEIKYGVVSGGSTMRFFEKSSHPTYSILWDFMNGKTIRIKTTTETRPPSSIFSTMQTSTLISPMSSSVSQSIDSENLKNDAAADEDKLVPQSTTKTFTSTLEDLKQTIDDIGGRTTETMMPSITAVTEKMTTG